MSSINSGDNENPAAPSSDLSPPVPSEGNDSDKSGDQATKQRSSGARSAPATSVAEGTAGSSGKLSTSKQSSATTAARAKPRDPMEAPVRKLSVNLIKTYKHINEVYYKKKREAKKKNLYNDGHDDENYDYKIIVGEVIQDRYRVMEKIGKGSFGQVVRAFDIKENCEVAIKIIKSKRPFYFQAKTEIELLKFLNEKDPNDQWFVVRLQETFLHHKHQCLVFEMLANNLYELLRNTRFRGVSLNLIKKFARQILKCLAFLSLPEINIIHCDLKPENILLRDPKRSAIKLIDFGSSCRADKRMYTYIQSRFYRSPEVMLGLKYGVEIDMWSLGCILVEMHTGEPLFNGTDEFDQMSRVVALRGMPPLDMIEKASKTKTFFELVTPKPGEAETSQPAEVVGGQQPYYAMKQKKSGSKRRYGGGESRTMSSILGVETGGPGGRRQGDPMHSAKYYLLFMDLIDRMLDYRPGSRIKPIEALNHPFFQEIDTANKSAQGGAPSMPGKATSSTNTSAGSGTSSQLKPEKADNEDDDATMSSPSEAAKADTASTAADNVKRDACTQTPIM